MAIALVPLALLWVSVERIQVAYAVMGALFMPLLALTLLIMNNRVRWVGRSFETDGSSTVCWQSRCCFSAIWARSSLGDDGVHRRLGCRWLGVRLRD